MAHGPDTEKLLAKIAENNKHLYIHHLDITSLPHLPDTITGIWCDNTNIENITSLPSKLEILCCGYTPLEKLCRLPSTLTFLSCEGSQLKVLPELPNGLDSLNISYCPITYLPELPNSLTYIKHFEAPLMIKPSNGLLIFSKNEIQWYNQKWNPIRELYRTQKRAALIKEELMSVVFSPMLA